MRRFNWAVAVAALMIVVFASNKAVDDPTNGNWGRSRSANAHLGRGAEWIAYEIIDFMPPPRVAAANFDRIHSRMTLGELVDLLGRGWMSRVESCGIITWSCEDGRQLQVWPSTYRPEDVIDKRWMTRLAKDQSHKPAAAGRTADAANGGDFLPVHAIDRSPAPALDGRDW